MSKIFNEIDNLLLNPNYSNIPICPDIAKLMTENFDAYKNKAIDHAKQNANKAIDDLMLDILGNV